MVVVSIKHDLRSYSFHMVRGTRKELLQECLYLAVYETMHSQPKAIIYS